MQPLPQYQCNEEYPESDGQLMAECTEQYDWLVKIKENLEIIFKNHPNVFVAGDLLWYPVQGHANISVAPDVFVVIGRPKGKRGSYRQWEEEHIVPQVVFEILSPNNTSSEMERKRQFYQQYGVQEYYMYDPAKNRLEIWVHQHQKLKMMPHLGGWDSPQLGIRFILDRETLHIFDAQGQPFLSSIELSEYVEQERQKADQERQKAQQERKKAEKAQQQAEHERLNAEKAQQQIEQERLNTEKARQQAEQERLNAEKAQQKAKQERQKTKQERQKVKQERQKAEQERQRAERLAAQLRALGIDPNL